MLFLLFKGFFIDGLLTSLGFKEHGVIMSHLKRQKTKDSCLQMARFLHKNYQRQKENEISEDFMSLPQEGLMPARLRCYVAIKEDDLSGIAAVLSVDLRISIADSLFVSLNKTKTHLEDYSRW